MKKDQKNRSYSKEKLLALTKKILLRAEEQDNKEDITPGSSNNKIRTKTKVKYHKFLIFIIVE